LTEERRDGVFELRALDAEVGGLRARGVELRFGLRDVLVGREAGVMLNLCQSKGSLISEHRRIQKLPLRIQHAKLKIVCCHFRLNGQPHVFEIGKGALRFKRVCLHRVANAAPEIQLPGGIKWQRVFGDGGRGRRRT
jgi:hypothetical protein